MNASLVGRIIDPAIRSFQTGSRIIDPARSAQLGPKNVAVV
jgi:hypothetical protein